MDKPQLVVVIRIRGPSGIDAETEYTLRLINLKRANHAVILPLSTSVRGILGKVEPYVTWGEATPETLVRLFRRADLQPGVKVEEELTKLGVTGYEELAEKICRGEIDVSTLRRIFKPTFRLHPPRGGFKGSIKRPVGQKGVHGYAGEKIGTIIEAMC
ncbi:MAG: 50S ribosomal protein L30 [Nitrososphaerota archaeon]